MERMGAIMVEKGLLSVSVEEDPHQESLSSWDVSGGRRQPARDWRGDWRDEWGEEIEHVLDDSGYSDGEDYVSGDYNFRPRHVTFEEEMFMMQDMFEDNIADVSTTVMFALSTTDIEVETVEEEIN